MAQSHKYMVPALKVAFRAWHEREGDSLPVRIYPRYTVHGVEVSILGAPDIIQIEVTPWSLSVRVRIDDRLFDILFQVHAFPTARGVEYADEDHEGWGKPSADGPGFETKAAFWEHYFFQPFARWLTDEYAPAAFLDVWMNRGKRMWMSEAKLCTEQPSLRDPPGYQAWWALEHAFFAELSARAARAEASDTIVFTDMSPDEIRWTRAALEVDDEAVCLQVSGLSEEGFLVLSSKIDPSEFTEEQLAVGRRLATERRVSRSAK